MTPSSRICRAPGLFANIRIAPPSRKLTSTHSLFQRRSISQRSLSLSTPFISQRPAWQQSYKAKAALTPSRLQQTRSISNLPPESSTGPFNTPLPPNDLFLPDQDLVHNASTTGHWYAGYLKDLGIDFGWGSSSLVQYLFEHLHMADGFSIGGTILTTAIIIRVLTFPLIISASHNGAKLSALKEVTDPIQAKMREAAKTGDQMAIQLARQDMRKVYVSADINLWKSFLPMLQIPIGFSFWRLTRNMADVPVPGMETGGFFWFTDLCFPDPLFILPLATGMLQHLTLRLGGEAGMSAASAKLRNAMMYGLPLLAVVFTSFAPAAVQISFCAAAGLSLCTTTILRQPGFRKMLGLAPRIVPAVVKPAGTETGPYRGTINVAGRVKSTSSTPSGRNTPFSSTSSSATATATAPRVKTNPFTGLVKTVTDYVGDVLPDAKARADSRMKKSMNSKSDQYELKRAKELEKEKWKWEDAQRAAERERRRR